MALHDQLHDRIDAREDLRERAGDLARELVARRFAEALDATESLEDALTLTVAWVSQALDPLTTEAVRTGARHQLRRKRRVGGAVR